MVGWVNVGAVSCGGPVEVGRPADVAAVGGHLHVAPPEGGDLYLAWTALGAFDLLA